MLPNRWDFVAFPLIICIIAMAAIRNNDRVGLIFFTDRVEHVVPPRKGKRHVLRIVRDLLAFEPKVTHTELKRALEYMQRTLRQHTVIFLVSDFQDEGYEHALKVLGRRHDIVAVTLNDPAEQNLPSVGLARMRDPETGEFLEVDTSDRRVRAAYAEHIGAELASRRRLLRRAGVDEVELTTDGSVIEPLLKFFRTRETRARR